MRISSPRSLRASASLLAALTLFSCKEAPTAPKATADVLQTVSGLSSNATATTLVISQVYGAGGNLGATLKNDFIEIFNPTSAPVTMTNWSVQYASAAGTTWAATVINGTVAAGGYFYIQESAGTGGVASTLTPDATGTIAMSGTAGKVLLAMQSAPLSGACPTGGNVLDLVPFGAGTNCPNPAPYVTTGNTQSTYRNNGGCDYTGSATADFAAAIAAPRNSTSPTKSCGTVVQPVATVTVTPDSTGVFSGSNTNFTAIATDAGGNATSTSFTWSSSNTAVATVNSTGVATGVANGLVTITATSANGIAGTAKLSVTTPVVVVQHAGDIVISQVYGGGGNNGSTLKNDFIELFNRTTTPIDVTGWSVQYGSANATTWSATPLTGIIPPGGYYLVKESAGAGGTVDLPAAEVTGTLTLGAAAGKVLLIQSSAPASGACPTGLAVVDQVSYGAGTNCGTSTAAPSASTAALRKSGGCYYTPDAAVDFTIGTPLPRNGATAPRSCVVGPLDRVQLSGQKAVLVGNTLQLTAVALDANDNIVPTATFAWTSGDIALATVSNSGLVTGVLANADSVAITATATAAGVTKSGTYNIKVNTDGINWIDLSSSATSFPAGFQTQLFATARIQQGGTIIPANFVFEAVDPQYMTVENKNGTAVVTGISAPTDGTKPGLRIIATPTAGGTPYTFVTRPVTIEAPVSAPASVYANQDEFGKPTPAVPADPNDMLIRRNQYVLSYNQSRGTPNWVSYELDARAFVSGQDRCNCFSADPLLPADKQIFTSDYTNGGYDRGHMTRSADRVLANVDNASTFYLTNVVPQIGDLNQGVWAQFENALADSARAGRAVYIITGPLYVAGKPLSFIKNEGKIAIPDSTWKVALIGPGNSGNPFTVANVQSFDDLTGLTLMAVNMPNIAGVRNDPWAKYLTTVEKIEASTGYDFLSLLNSAFQPALDYKDRAPVARATTSGGTTEGSTITFDASTSSDPDAARTDLGGRTEALTYKWHFSDGTDATGATVSKTVATHAPFTATLTVTDAFGWPNSTTASVTLTNVAPTATFTAPAAQNEGAPFTISLTGATDPSTVDAAALRFAFDCGAGYGAPTTTATFTCTAADNGTVTVRGKVIDTGDLFTEYTADVTISNVAPTASFTAPVSVLRGNAIALSLTNVVDPSSVDRGFGFLFTFDCGAGYGDGSSASTATCPTTASGTRTVKGKVNDKDGGTTEYSASVIIAPNPPTAVFTAPSVGIARASFTLSLDTPTAATAADLTALRYQFDCGTGYGALGNTATASCTPTAPGTVTVRGRIVDLENAATEYTAQVNVSAPAIIAALVRHAPTLNGTVNGSVRMMTGENVSLNGNSNVTGQLYLPGIPTVRLNGKPKLGGTLDWFDAPFPTNYTVTLSGNASLGAIVRRTDGTELPAVSAPQSPLGTRSVTIDNGRGTIGSWDSVLNFSLVGEGAPVAIPAGAYGNISATGNTTIVLGVAGSTEPTVYDFQKLTLNDAAQIQIVGPVVVTVGNAVSFKGNAGSAAHPEWFSLRIAQGGLSLIDQSKVYASVLAPNGTVTISGNSAITGALAADGLSLNGNAVLKILSAIVP